MDTNTKPNATDPEIAGRAAWRRRLYVIIFGHDTPAGKLFDLVLIVAIVASVLVVMLDSIIMLRTTYGPWFRALEWFFTILFTLEYVLRLLSARSARRYATSFFGVIDVLAILPTYLSLFFPAGRYFTIVRVLRVLRVFRVLKLATYVGEARVLALALKRSSHKIIVFVLTVLTIVVIVGGLMYLVEGHAYGFTSIPRSMYWAIVTLTTVGYGDIAPQTSLGQTLASFVMILGYAIIAVPTGIVTVELAEAAREGVVRCPSCNADGHRPDANYCRKCGANLMVDMSEV